MRNERDWDTLHTMIIRSIRHRGLRRLIENNNPQYIQPGLTTRVAKVVAALVAADSVNDFIEVAPRGWRIHRLLGYQSDRWSVSVSGNFRITFEESDGYIYGLNLEDYHCMVKNGIKVRMTPPHPGDFIRTEVIEDLGLTVTEAAAILGVRRATLSALLNENSRLTPEMALRIEKAFDVQMDTMLKMQAWYDATMMRQRADEIVVERYVEDAHDDRELLRRAANG